MKMVDYVTVRGISEKGTEKVYTYMCLSARDHLEAIASACRWADGEYTCEYDEDMKPIPNTVYKEFETITSVEVHYMEG